LAGAAVELVVPQQVLMGLLEGEVQDVVQIDLEVQEPQDKEIMEGQEDGSITHPEMVMVAVAVVHRLPELTALVEMPVPLVEEAWVPQTT
tara:strand:+ start:271 stop:540 length:270 start_codon:yes stop_codon:yes gene_type:complete